LDAEKIRKLVGATDTNDPKVDQMFYIIMKDFVDRDEHWLCDALRLEDKSYVIVISLGTGSLGGNLEDLKKKELPIPRYLSKTLSSALVGPDVFQFLGW